MAPFECCSLALLRSSFDLWLNYWFDFERSYCFTIHLCLNSVWPSVGNRCRHRQSSSSLSGAGCARCSLLRPRKWRWDGRAVVARRCSTVGIHMVKSLGAAIADAGSASSMTLVIEGRCADGAATSWPRFGGVGIGLEWWITPVDFAIAWPGFRCFVRRWSCYRWHQRWSSRRCWSIVVEGCCKWFCVSLAVRSECEAVEFVLAARSPF